MLIKKEDPGKVEPPQQNIHRWWGFLRIDPGTVVIDGTIAPGVQCVFVKTSRDAHFISEGTAIKKVRVFSTKLDAENALRQKAPAAGANQPQIDKLAADLYSSDFPDLPIVEILEIDNVNTSPLTRELNLRTMELFLKDSWVEEHGKIRGPADIGEDDIKIGREMPPL